MKLFYYQEKFNFGDALNPWLWEKLLPGVLDKNEDTAFVGIGTLLNEWLPYYTHSARRRIVFSTGVGYGNGLPIIDESYQIYCLRGPLSAIALGVAPELAVTDGAVLLRRYIQPASHKSYRFGYIPHWQQADYNWDLVCQELGWRYIDPRWSIDKILAAINDTEILLAEAMHGAIVADALRVPWIPIVTDDNILSFKWHDWCQSIDVEYEPVFVQPLQSVALTREPSQIASKWLAHKQAVDRLETISRTILPKLSSDRQIEALTLELETRLAQLKADLQQDISPVSVARSSRYSTPTPDDSLVDLTQFYHQSPAKQIELPEPDLDVANAAKISAQILANSAEIQAGKLDNTIVSISWLQWQQIEQAILANPQSIQTELQAELALTQQQLADINEQLNFVRQQLTNTQQQLNQFAQKSIELQTVITSMEQSKFWKVHQRWMRFKDLMSVFLG